MVRLPTFASVGRSRRLFTIRMAVLSAPTPAPASHASTGKVPTCRYVVPATAISPKKTKTKRSPRPW